MVAQIQQALITQNNHGYENPFFVVYDHYRLYDVAEDDATGHVWLNPEQDYRQADERTARLLTATEERSFEGTVKNWEKRYYRDVARFVTACFTRAGAEEYVRVNGHNHERPYVSTASLWRNEEMMTVRQLLLRPTE